MAERVLILGGGMAALAAAFDLTHPNNPNRGRYEVTLLQQGWRLGGKGASGRNLDADGFGRIEEHGLHNLFGFYDNAFRLLRDCYAELDRPAGHPLRTWRDGLSPESTAVFVEETANGPRPWQLFNPTNRFEPGEGEEWLPLWDTVVQALCLLDLNAWHVPAAPPTTDRPSALPLALRPVAAALYAACRAIVAVRAGGPPAGSRRRRWSRRVGEIAAERALHRLQRAVWQVARHRVHSDDGRRGWVMFHFATGILRGLLDAGVLGRSLDPLDDVDFRAWMLRYLIEDGGLVRDGALMRVMYESSFAYRDGDTRIPEGSTFAPKADYGAGSLLRGLIRANFAYKGAFGWKFTSGTGDVLFAPLYEVLKRRGVRFEFFQRVTAIEADPRGERIDAVRVATQVKLAVPEYDPLVDVGGVPCWPSRPRWEQIEGGASLSADGVDLEAFTPTHAEAGARTLRFGADFDQVILGISVGAFPYLCPDLIAKNQRFGDMVRALRTTRTAAAQVWMEVPIEATGWRPKGRPITGFWYDEASPLNVWADLTHLVRAESWGAAPPAHLSWFVSPMADEAPLTDSERGPVDTEAGIRGDEARATVRAHAKKLLRQAVPERLMPKLAGPSGLRWEVLADRRATPGVGEARLEAQYLRANTSPSERYVLSVAGSGKFRLGPHEPGVFSNLYLAGDWTKNGLDSGAMESAVLSGRQAAGALSGWPRIEDIPGARVL